MNLNLLKKGKKRFWHYFIASQKTLFSKYSSFHKSDFFLKNCLYDQSISVLVSI